MTAPASTQDRSVRLRITPDEWKRLKMLAVEREQDIITLVTAAVQSSPLTKKAFQ